MDVGYIGLGVMGGALVDRLLLSRSLHVYDLNADTVAAKVKAGATAAASAADLAAKCDIVLLCLPKSEHVRAAIFGPNGLIEGLKPGALIVDQTSGDPTETRKMAAELAARGIHMIDAPVSGGANGAKAGTIAIMIGGDATQIDRVRPIMADISPNVFVCGEVGAGQVLKIINNMISSSVRFVTLEGVAMGVRNGLDLQVMTDVLNAGGAESRATRNLLPALVKGQADSFFLMSLMLKDLNLAAKLASDTGVPSPYGHLTRAMMQMANNRFGPDSNYYEITELVAEQAGFSFRKDDAANE